MSTEEELPDATQAAGLPPAAVDYSAIGTVCDHDPQLSRRLRASLAVIARRTDDPSLRDLAVGALHGRLSVRRVFEHPTFRQMASASADRLAEGIDRLDEQQRSEVLGRVGSRDTSEATALALMEDRPRPD